MTATALQLFYETFAKSQAMTGQNLIAFYRPLGYPWGGGVGTD